MQKTPIDMQDMQIKTMPRDMQPFLVGAKLYDSSCGASARVIYSDRGYYIKMAAKGTLQREADMTAYFAGHGLGAPLSLYLTTDEKDYMVTEAAQGEDATMYLDAPKKLCQLLADGMHRLHALDVAELPLSPTMEAYHQYEDTMHTDTCIHGDFCLPNVICRDGRFVCLIDMGLAGRGDRHIDLYWATWSLQFNLKTDAYRDYFLDAYGREAVDPERLRIAAAVEA